MVGPYTGEFIEKRLGEFGTRHNKCNGKIRCHETCRERGEGEKREGTCTNRCIAANSHEALVATRSANQRQARLHSRNKHRKD